MTEAGFPFFATYRLGRRCEPARSRVGNPLPQRTGGVHPTTKNLVVVGGGFAGTKASRALERTLPPDWTLTLISQDNFMTFNPCCQKWSVHPSSRATWCNGNGRAA